MPASAKASKTKSPKTGTIERARKTTDLTSKDVRQSYIRTQLATASQASNSKGMNMNKHARKMTDVTSEIQINQVVKVPQLDTATLRRKTMIKNPENNRIQNKYKRIIKGTKNKQYVHVYL